MVVIRSNLVPRAQAYLKALEKQAEAAIYQAMIKTAVVGEARVKGIIEKEAYDTGRLLRSVNSKITHSPNQLKLVIGTNLEYAYYLEHGRKPGKFPNLDALVKWVGRKLRRQGIGTRVNVSFDQLKALAKSAKGEQKKAYRAHLSAVYLIGRKIATKGVREKFIFKRLEDGLLAYFRKQAYDQLRSIQ